MLLNSSKPPIQLDVSENSDSSIKTTRKWVMLLILPMWVFISFFTARLFVFLAIWLIKYFDFNINYVNETLVNSVSYVFIYIISLLIAVLLPKLLNNSDTNLSDIGLKRLPYWKDIFVTPAALVIYFISSSLLIVLATRIMPSFDINQVQDTGFGHMSQQYQYILAFITLVIIAPIAEEVLFRGYLYGKLKKYIPVWLAILATSLLFGAIHGAWNLAIDTFMLSIVLCWLRESTDSIWASILLHMTKNGIAYSLLFIYPLLFTTLGR